MPPKRKAAGSRTNPNPTVAGGGEVSTSGGGESTPRAKRARIEEGKQNGGSHEEQIDELQDEQSVDPVEQAQVDDGSSKKRTRGRPRAAANKSAPGEEIEVQASLKGPSGKKGRGRPAKVRPAASGAPGVEEQAQSTENNPGVHPQQLQQEHDNVPANGAEDMGQQSQEPVNGMARREEPLPVPPEQHFEQPSPRDDQFQSSSHEFPRQNSGNLSPDDPAVSPHPSSEPPPHGQGEDLPPPPLPYPPPAAYPYNYSYPAAYPHGYPPAPPPPGMEYSASFSTVDTSQNTTSFHSSGSSYPMDTNVPAGNPFPPPHPHVPPPHMYHSGYGAPMHPPEGHDHNEDGQPQASGSRLTGTPSVSDMADDGPPPGHPAGVPYTGPDGRKRVPVRVGARSGRGDHVACHFCRQRKLKCDGRRPTCGHCSLRNNACTYDGFIRRRGPGKKEKNSRRSKAASSDEMTPANLANAGMHLGTLDAVSTPSADQEQPASSVDGSARRRRGGDSAVEPAERQPRQRRPKNWQPEAEPEEEVLRPKPRPHIGPMPTPTASVQPIRRRRPPLAGGVLRLQRGSDDEDVYTGMKDGQAAYAVASNERLENVEQYYPVASGALPGSSAGATHFTYGPGYQEGVGEGDDEGDEEYQQPGPPQGYGHGQAAWPAEPPGQV